MKRAKKSLFVTRAIINTLIILTAALMVFGIELIPAAAGGFAAPPRYHRPACAAAHAVGRYR